MKTCTLCNSVLHVAEFFSEKLAADGLRSQCKPIVKLASSL